MVLKRRMHQEPDRLHVSAVPLSLLRDIYILLRYIYYRAYNGAQTDIAQWFVFVYV